MTAMTSSGLGSLVAPRGVRRTSSPRTLPPKRRRGALSHFQKGGVARKFGPASFGAFVASGAPAGGLGAAQIRKEYEDYLAEVERAGEPYRPDPTMLQRRQGVHRRPRDPEASGLFAEYSPAEAVMDVDVAVPGLGIVPQAAIAGLLHARSTDDPDSASYAKELRQYNEPEALAFDSSQRYGKDSPNEVASLDAKRAAMIQYVLEHFGRLPSKGEKTGLSLLGPKLRTYNEPTP